MAAIANAFPDLFAPPGRGVILSGRGPIWGYALMLHAAHPTLWVAVHDPRLGAVVVQSHTLAMVTGQVIALQDLQPFDLSGHPLDHEENES